MKDYRIVRNVKEYRDGTKYEYYTIEVGYSIFGLFTYWCEYRFVCGERGSNQYEVCRFETRSEAEKIIKEMKDCNENRYEVEPIIVGTKVFWRPTCCQGGLGSYRCAIEKAEVYKKTWQEAIDKWTVVKHEKFVV